MYLIRDGESSYKIGSAKDPNNRLDDLQVGCCRRLVLVWSIRTELSRWIEEYLHRKFTNRHIIGEWFSLDAEEVQWIMSLTREEIRRLREEEELRRRREKEEIHRQRTGRPRQFDIEQALDAALLLFWRHGYEGTSLAALTKAMGINVPSLYAAFGDKETLFKKVLERYLQKPASYLPKALEQPTARRAIEKLFRGAIDMVMNPHHPDGCLLVQGALASGPVAASIRKELSLVRAAAEAGVRRRLERAIGEGDLPANVDAAKLARYVLTVLWGLSVQAAGGATPAQLKQVVQLAMQNWPNEPKA